ncbi:hypothetical protein Roomu2_00060 [Pseudomonas phage vB_PpuM-Roomu-2]|uniref:Uncharacterized protein n=1 Tax=Pseudomonas phage vB_PpuM-Roomu-2 TaxID=3132621 RepID=A0AAX4MZT8_9CAUD
MGWFKKKPDPLLPRRSIKPPDNIIFAIATGEHSVYLFPYQYVNWALEFLGEQPSVKVGETVSFGMCAKVHAAAVKYVKERSNEF